MMINLDWGVVVDAANRSAEDGRAERISDGYLVITGREELSRRIMKFRAARISENSAETGEVKTNSRFQ